MFTIHLFYKNTVALYIMTLCIIFDEYLSICRGLCHSFNFINSKGRFTFTKSFLQNCVISFFGLPLVHLD